MRGVYPQGNMAVEWGWAGALLGAAAPAAGVHMTNFARPMRNTDRIPINDAPRGTFLGCGDHDLQGQRHGVVLGFPRSALSKPRGKAGRGILRGPVVSCGFLEGWGVVVHHRPPPPQTWRVQKHSLSPSLFLGTPFFHWKRTKHEVRLFPCAREKVPGVQVGGNSHAPRGCLGMNWVATLWKSCFRARELQWVQP